MSELHRFLFEGQPVRGVLVRLTDDWQEVLRRRATDGGFPAEVNQLMGEMAAAALLMQANVKFNGSVVFQIMGGGPVKVAVAEATSDFGFRCTATLTGTVPEGADLQALVNATGHARCAITLDPRDRQPGQQPYQGLVSLDDASGLTGGATQVAQALEHYMRQSEQLDTRILLAANDQVAAGLLLQRLPVDGVNNLGAAALADAGGDSGDGAFAHLTMLADSLKPEELLSLPGLDVLHRLYWNEAVLRYEPDTPRFACSCSRERVGRMIVSLGSDEIESLLSERDNVEVGCEFCGIKYHFDPVDAARLFTDPQRRAPESGQLQ
jgi:molecular chaperone Hsp33